MSQGLMKTIKVLLKGKSHTSQHQKQEQQLEQQLESALPTDDAFSSFQQLDFDEFGLEITFEDSSGADAVAVTEEEEEESAPPADETAAPPQSDSDKNETNDAAKGGITDDTKETVNAAFEHLTKAFKNYGNIEPFKEWANGDIGTNFEKCYNSANELKGTWEKLTGDKSEAESKKESLRKWNTQHPETINSFIKDFKAALDPLRLIGNSIIRNEYSKNLGNAVCKFYNGLATFYNFLTSNEKPRPQLEMEEKNNSFSRKEPSFVALNEVTEGKNISVDDCEQINEFFEGTLEKLYTTLNKSYTDINKRKEELQKASGVNAKKSISFESTESNQDMVNHLVKQNLLTTNKWDYDLKNLRQFDALNKIVTDLQKVSAEAVNAHKSEKGLKSFFNSGRNRNTVNESERTGLMAKTLDNILKNFKNEQAAYVAYFSEYEKKFPERIQQLKNVKKEEPVDLTGLEPLVLRLDSIVFPILSGISQAYGDGVFPTDEGTKKTLTENIPKLLPFLHDPKSAGFKESAFINKAEMTPDELEAYYMNKREKIRDKRALEQREKEELRNLLLMNSSLKDTERLKLEERMVATSKSATGKFNGKSRLDDDDTEPDFNEMNMPKEKSGTKEKSKEEKIDLGNPVDTQKFYRFRTMLRVIGLIAQRYKIEGYNYSENGSNNSGARLMHDFKNKNPRTSAEKNILSKVDSFAEKISELTKTKNEKEKITLNDDERAFIDSLPTQSKSDISQSYSVALEKLLKNSKLSGVRSKITESDDDDYENVTVNI